jgi:hypothetical protein
MGWPATVMRRWRSIKKAAFPENLEGSLDLRGFPETLDSLRVP